MNPNQHIHVHTYLINAHYLFSVHKCAYDQNISKYITKYVCMFSFICAHIRVTSSVNPAAILRPLLAVWMMPQLSRWAKRSCQVWGCPGFSQDPKPGSPSWVSWPERRAAMYREMHLDVARHCQFWTAHLQREIRVLNHPSNILRQTAAHHTKDKSSQILSYTCSFEGNYIVPVWWNAFEIREQKQKVAIPNKTLFVLTSHGFVWK